MKTDKLDVSKLVLLGLLAVLASAVIGAGFSRGANSPQTIATVPQQQGDMPPAQSTSRPVLPGITQTPSLEGNLTPTTLTQPATTPTIAALQPPVFVTPDSITSMTLEQDVDLEKSHGLKLKKIVDSEEPIHSLTWSPAGDKLLYVTKSGKLYWSELDGSNATLLHDYDPDTIFSALEDQGPLSNTLLVAHRGPAQGLEREPGHLDVIRFIPGQAPTLEEVPGAGSMSGIHWWNPDRASGILHAWNEGADKLVTVDGNGRIVDERVVPYMFAGYVQPGGEWLAYSTGPQSTDTPFVGSDPNTVYLLNLSTGQRLQVSPSGKGSGVAGWSPDGNWFIMGAELDGKSSVMLSSVDGRQRVLIPELGSGIAWNKKSNKVASYVLLGGEDHESTSDTWISSLNIIDVADKKVSKADKKKLLPAASSDLLMKPVWSPDGSQLVVLSFDPKCQGMCSKLAPAFYVLSTSSK